MGEDDPVSLEYIEDPYFPGLDQNATPSLDEICYGEEEDDDSAHWPLETELYLRSLTLDQLLSVPDEDIENILIDPIHDLDDQQRVEAEFVPQTSSSDGERFRNHLQSLSRIRKIRFLTRKAMRDIKVTFVDLSKPYFVKISSNENYKKFLNISSSPGRLDYTCRFSLVSLGLSSSSLLLATTTHTSNSTATSRLMELFWILHSF